MASLFSRSSLLPRAISRPSICSDCLARARISQVQIRGKKKLAKRPRMVAARLQRDVSGYGPAGSIVPVKPRLMRTTWYPGHIAEYVLDAELGRLGIERKELKKLSSFRPRREEDEDEDDEFENEEEEKLKEVEEVQSPATFTRAIDPIQTVEILQNLMPQMLEFYRSIKGGWVGATEIDESSAESLTTLLDGEEETLDFNSNNVQSPVLTSSIRKTEVLDLIKSNLAQDERGKAINLDVNNIELWDEQSLAEGENAKVDRINTLGNYIVMIKVKGCVESVQTRIVVEEKSQERDLL